MTTSPETAANSNPSKKLMLAAVLFAIAALGTITAYKSRAVGEVANNSKADAVVRVAEAAGAAAGTTSTGFSADQKADIEKIIRGYLLNNPELLFEVQTALESKMQAQAADRAKKAISENASDLFKRTDAPIAGKADGDITVVEFFDYNCGFCKRGLDDIAKLIKNDKNVRVVFKELPILSKASEEASRVALAAKLQGKYWEVHSALLAHRGQANKETALKLAEKEGLDVKKLEADMDSEVVTKEINLVRKLADKMGVNGTPHFLIGDRAIAGAPEDLYEQLMKNIADLRKKGCAVC